MIFWYFFRFKSGKERVNALTRGNPRILIAGTGTSVGKTTFTMGLMAAFRRRGITVQGYKCGPDFIDPGFHRAITGRPGRNLDPWMMGKEYMIHGFCRGSEQADLSILEGMMGLFDGKEPTDITGSSAEVAEILQCPVLLVVSIEQMALSAAAVVKGYKSFHPGVKVAGALLNRAGGEGHAGLVTAAIEKHCNIPVLGWLPSQTNWALPERHLGLVPAWEGSEWTNAVVSLADVIEKQVNLDEVLRLAMMSPQLKDPLGTPSDGTDAFSAIRPVLAVARDDAFHFYYEENLELLERYGVQLVFFQPLQGETVPEEADGLWIGGGFPEEFLPELARQEAVKESIRCCIRAGMPVYAECGGHMFLAKEICVEEKRFPMVGAIPGTVRMSKRLTALGYREVQARKDTILLRKGEMARGQEFHYSMMDLHAGDGKTAYEWDSGYPEGYADGQLLSSYIHLHFASNPAIAKRWSAKMREFRLKRLAGANQSTNKRNAEENR